MFFGRSLPLLVAISIAGAARLNSRLRNATAAPSAGTMGRPKGAHTQTLINKQNVQYSAEFTMGTPPQVIKGIFDTGSFELVVRSTRCTACAHPTPAYDSSKSTSYDKNGSYVQHVYGSGPCVSMLGYDNVCVGDMCAPRQALWEIVQHQIPVLDQANFAAIVGIGPQFGYGNAEKTLLMSYGIDEFSVCLQRESGANGFLTWGPIASPETKKESYVTVPSIGEHHWTAHMTEVWFGAKSGEKKSGQMSICKPGECAAIVDSGTSLIAAPTAHLQMLSQMVPPIAEDCSNLHELPTFHFTLGDGKKLTLPPSAYVMRITGGVMEANNVWDILFFKPKIHKVNMCMPAFMAMDMQSPDGMLWILGMPFFRYYHTSFDRKNKEMIFATAGPDCEPQPLKLGNGTSLLATRTESKADFTPFDVDLSLVLPPTFGFTLKTNTTQKSDMIV